MQIANLTIWKCIWTSLNNIENKKWLQIVFLQMTLYARTQLLTCY